MKPWLISAAMLLATNCAATPVVLTSSSSGYVLFNGVQNTANEFAAVSPGEDFQMTTELAYDTDWVSSQDTATQAVTGAVTMRIGFGTFSPAVHEFTGTGTATTTYKPVDANGHGGTLTLDIAFADPDDPRWSYRVVRSFAWLPGERPGESLLGQLRYASTTLGGGDALGVLENGAIVSGLGLPASEMQLTISPVPEPATYGMLLAGLAGVGLYARRRKAA